MSERKKEPQLSHNNIKEVQNTNSVHQGYIYKNQEMQENKMTCQGCMFGIANQLGHMDYGGCLYKDEDSELTYEQNYEDESTVVYEPYQEEEEVSLSNRYSRKQDPVSPMQKNVMTHPQARTVANTQAVKRCLFGKPWTDVRTNETVYYYEDGVVIIKNQ